MSEIVTIATQKGGTGKTTTAHALGAGLTGRGYRVLFIDLDPQQNLTYILRADPGAATSYEVLTGEATAAQAIQPGPGGDVITSSPSLAGANLDVVEAGREYRLREALEPIRGQYDFIVIDTPPSLGILTVTALTASDRVIIPAQADILSLQGIGQLYNTMRAVQLHANPRLKITGILLTRHSSRAILSRDLARVIANTAGELGTFIYSAAIREGIVVKEAQASQQDLYSYAARSNPAQDYQAFVEEFMERTGAAPSCDNCKYLDSCPADYQAENGPYCENYERSANNG